MIARAQHGDLLGVVSFYPLDGHLTLAQHVQRHARSALFDQPLAVRRLPDFQTIAGVVGLDAQVLHQEVAIALEARVRGNRQFRRNLERLVNPQMLRLAALGRSGTLASRLRTR